MARTGTPGDGTSRPTRRIALGLGAIALIAVVIAVWFLIIRDDSPAAFDIDDATSRSTPPAGTDGDGGTADSTDDTEPDTDGRNGADGEPTGLDGPWVVAAGSGSEAGFRVQEELASIGANTVVGRTDDVDARLVVEGGTVSEAEVAVGLADLATDDTRRDNRMREALAVEEFPTATFTLTEPIDLGEIPDEDETVSVSADGEMTIKGVTNPVTVTLDARSSEGTIVVVGSLPVTFSDYGVEAPTAPVVLSVDDNGTVEFQLFFVRA